MESTETQKVYLGVLGEVLSSHQSQPQGRARLVGKIVVDFFIWLN